MFIFRLVENGPQGMAHLFPGNGDEQGNHTDGDEIEDIDEYGIDWDVLGDSVLMQHFHANNPDNWEDGDGEFSRNGFGQDGLPIHMAEVECEVESGLFPAEFVALLETVISHDADINLTCRSMANHRFVWRRTLQLCQYLHQQE